MFDRIILPHPGPLPLGENSPKTSRIELSNRRAGSGTGLSPVCFDSHGRDARATNPVRGEGVRRTSEGYFHSRRRTFVEQIIFPMKFPELARLPLARYLGIFIVHDDLNL